MKIYSVLFMQWLTSAFKGKWPRGGGCTERERGRERDGEEDERDKMSEPGLIDGEGPATPSLGTRRDRDEGEARERDKKGSKEMAGRKRKPVAEREEQSGGSNRTGQGE